MPKVEYSERARANIRDIGHYTILNWGAQQADKYVGELLQRIEQAMKWPEGAPEITIGDDIVRKLIIAHHVVYYSIEPDRVLIRAILHFSQLPDRLRE
jgi:toxin ParE1/3/4